MSTTLPPRSARPFLPSDRPPRPSYLERAFAASALSALHFGKDPEATARELWNDDEITPLVLRAATAPAMTSVSGWAAELATASVASFLESLKPMSAAAALIAKGLKVPLGRANSVVIPRGGVPAAVDAAWVAEGAPGPAIQFTLGSATLGPLKKMLVHCVLTRELVTVGGEPVIRQLLRETVAATLDATMFGSAAGTSSKPPGLLNSVTPLTPSADTNSHEAFIADIGALAGAIAAAGGSADLLLVAAPGQAQVAKLMMAGDIVASTALAAGTVLAIDVQGFVSAFGSEPKFRSSLEATIHMESATPLPIGTPGSPPTVASPTRSAYQTDVVATQVSLDAAWCMRAPGLVQVISGVVW